MKLTDLQQMWSEDCKIDETNLGKESAKVPLLHSKYINLLSSTRLNLRKSESEYYNCRRKKYRYYRGEMSRQELEEEGWSQWQGTKPLKNEIDEFLQGDQDLIILQDKIEYYKTVLNQLEQIIRSINSRTWDIKSCIEWAKLSNGLM
jgi:hypothetical protein